MHRVHTCDVECNAHTQVGSTALIHAAASNHADCVRLLDESGADKNAEDNVRVGNVMCLCNTDCFRVTLT